MKLIWTREALERLSEIEKYISKENPENAIRFVDYLIEKGESIKDFPKIGRMVPEIGQDNIREIIAKRYRIIYRISGEQIEILTVYEGHRLLRFEKLENG